jgi:hypothetical protein
MLGESTDVQWTILWTSLRAGAFFRLLLGCFVNDLIGK